MRPIRTIRYEYAREGLLLKVQLGGHTIQMLMLREEYKDLNSIDFEYLKECNYALLEAQIRKMYENH